ncbi:hypothetical protein RB195_001331 [Necator americanus]|uniref:Uncharacterized protein n=1 Tax=Necator americanus TaxID=51031 RepID=A0ABR1DDT9_NECAM
MCLSEVVEDRWNACGDDDVIGGERMQMCVIVWLSHSTVHIRAARWRREPATRDSPPLYETGQTTISTMNVNDDPRTPRKQISSICASKQDPEDCPVKRIRMSRP